jgi:hypothetical protein
MPKAELASAKFGANQETKKLLFVAFRTGRMPND